ncbi:DNA polymerase III subunit delta' [Desulfotruncus alcoholivorax]|uniref:DNA polymerase III subunit delta' n=1 Tax=Desulfotruncus alcoholivorax TaxID=265477 RepID=UPI0004260B9D|nr:DNA polymerase III subunit delta' [Desulfotruncus alcoholivorax]
MLFLHDLAGHERIKESLFKARQLERISHAYLFSGPPGVGKKTAGLAFARALLCKKGDTDACGFCDDCLWFERGVHPDLKIIRPQGSFIKIAQLRELQDSAALTSFRGGRQVYLIEQAEKMTNAAANCLLKILEDPPAEVVFILVADDGTLMLSTVMSRCQHYRFNPLGEEEVLKVIGANLGGNIEKARVAAKMSMGCPGRALSMLNGLDQREKMLNLLLCLTRQRRYMPVDGLDGREELDRFINCAKLFFRDALVWKISGSKELLINVDYQEAIAELAGTYEEEELLDILLTLEGSARRLAGNANRRLLFDSLVLQIAGSEREV